MTRPLNAEYIPSYPMSLMTCGGLTLGKAKAMEGLCVGAHRNRAI
jgi:hypothetical protein